MSDNKRIFIDDDICIDDITEKLSQIRNTLGLKQSEEPFDKIFNTPYVQLYKQDIEVIASEDQQSQWQEPKQLRKDMNNSVMSFENNQLQHQISNLQNKLSVLKNIEVKQSDKNLSTPEKEIYYMQQELKAKNSQLLQYRIYVKKVEDDLRVENQILKDELLRNKQIYEKLIESSDLQGDLKEYILHLEIELQMTKQELNIFTQKKHIKLCQQQEFNDELKQQQDQIVNNIQGEYQQMYSYQIKELQNICKILSAEKLNSDNLDQGSKLNKMYQEAIDEKILLESKLESVENQLKVVSKSSMKKEFWMSSVKSVYDNRLHEMKKMMIYWKNRTQQVEQIVSQWFQRIRDENSKLKKDLLQKQQKMFKVFEGLIKEIFNSLGNQQIQTQPTNVTSKKQFR